MSFDGVEANAAFAKKFDFPYKLLCDTDRKLGIAYGACADAKAGYANRISYLIDEQGKVKGGVCEGESEAGAHERQLAVLRAAADRSSGVRRHRHRLAQLHAVLRHARRCS